MNKSILAWIMAAAVLAVITFTVSTSMEWGGNTVERSAALTALVISLVGAGSAVWGYFSRKAADIPEHDERIDTITMRAVTYSFQIGIIFMVGLIWVFTFLHNMSAVLALSASVLVMGLAFLVFRWYLNRRGDAV
jgi:archaellum biogenesis protein FlaJ (TadC family)